MSDRDDHTNPRDADTALILRYLDGQLSDDEFAALEARLHDDADFRSRFIAMTIHAGYIAAVVAPDGVAAADDESDIIEAEPIPVAQLGPRDPIRAHGGRVRSEAIRYAAAAVLLIAAAVVVTLMQRDTTNPADTAAPAGRTVAAMLNTGDAEFADRASAPQSGDTLTAGPLRLTSGTAQVMFNSSAVVSLSGPCDFDMIGDNAGRLSAGSIDVYVPERAHGFAVELPDGVRVVDLGTRFRVSVLPSDASDVEVFRGRVRVERPNRSEAYELVADSIARVVPNSPIRITREAGKLRTGAVISRAADWLGASTMTSTNWEFRRQGGPDPQDAWRSLGSPLEWSAKRERFENSTRPVTYPIVDRTAIRINGPLRYQERRWAIADWVCPQDGLELKANDGVLDSQIGSPTENEAPGSQIVVAIFDDSAKRWTVLLDSIGDDDQQVSIPLDRRRFALDAGDRIRIAWRATGSHNEQARLNDSALAFTVVGVRSRNPSRPDAP
ncbi:MAG: hypothetical protein GC159_21135 [Phycisphaera sp.]|nr:hypothetical protein [Phycisphaera sp.]